MANYSICGGVGANTGEPDCPVTRGIPVQLIPGSASFSPSDYATQSGFQAAFLSKIKQANGAASKLFPFPVIQGVTDQTEAASIGTLGLGLKVKLKRSNPGYEFDVIAGSSLEKRLIKFDGKILPIFIFDDQGNIGGVLDSTKNFKGAKWLVGVEPRPYGDGANVKTTKISISLVDPRDFIENYKFASTTFSSNDLVGLQDGELYFISKAANVYKIGARIVTDEINTVINLAALYSTQLASAALFDAYTGASFTTPLAITSVAYDAALAALTVTFDSTAHTALAANTPIKLVPKGPATLDAADVTSIEIAAVIVTK